MTRRRTESYAICYGVVTSRETADYSGFTIGLAGLIRSPRPSLLWCPSLQWEIGDSPNPKQTPHFALSIAGSDRFVLTADGLVQSQMGSGDIHRSPAGVCLVNVGSGEVLMLAFTV